MGSLIFIFGGIYYTYDNNNNNNNNSRSRLVVSQFLHHLGAFLHTFFLVAAQTNLFSWFPLYDFLLSTKCYQPRQSMASIVHFFIYLSYPSLGVSSIPIPPPFCLFYCLFPSFLPSFLYSVGSICILQISFSRSNYFCLEPFKLLLLLLLLSIEI